MQQQAMINATPDEFARLLHDFSERLLQSRKVSPYQKLHVPPFVVLHPYDERAFVMWARVNAPIQEALDSPPAMYVCLSGPQKPTDLYFGTIHAMKSIGGQTIVTLYYWDQGKRWLEGLWKLLLKEFRQQGILCEMKIADDDTARSPGRPKLTELEDQEIEDRKNDLRRHWEFLTSSQELNTRKEAAEKVGHSPKTMKAWDDMWPEVGEEVKKLEMERIRKSKR